jgi:RNA polymerase sigma-70 factor (ECF subfamily)
MTPAEVEHLFRERGPMVLRRARQILGDTEEAREALQEIFAGFLGSGAGFAGRSSVTTWLYGVTTHHCLNRLRNRRTRERLLAERGAPQPAPPPTAEAIATAAELLARMPDELATVVVYYYLDEMSHAEIARLVGSSRRHVGDLVERARAWLEREGKRSAS